MKKIVLTLFSSHKYWSEIALLSNIKESQQENIYISMIIIVLQLRVVLECSPMWMGYLSKSLYIFHFLHDYMSFSLYVCCKIENGIRYSTI